MRRNRRWLIGLMLIAALGAILWGNLFHSPLPQAVRPFQSSPAQAQSPSPSPSPAPEATSGTFFPLPLEGQSYQDPAARFQVGIIEGYTVSVLDRGSPLIESPQGDLAYTVVTRSRSTDRPLSNGSLAQIAIETFERGEGFQAGEFREAPSGGALIRWTGNLTTGGQAQPLSGAIIARQQGRDVVMLLIAATESATTPVDDAISVLGQSLQAL